MNRRLRMTFIILVALGMGLGLGACAMLHQVKFGQDPSGSRLASHTQGVAQFQKRRISQYLADAHTGRRSEHPEILWENLFSKTERLRPQQPLPIVRLEYRDQMVLDRDQDTVIWLGHSSFYINLAAVAFWSILYSAITVRRYPSPIRSSRNGLVHRCGHARDRLSDRLP